VRVCAAQTATDVAIVEKALATTFTGGLVRFGDELEKKTSELLDSDDGALPRSFEQFKPQLEELLATPSTPTASRACSRCSSRSRRSALIDPDEESPLARYRGEIVRVVEKETSKVKGAVEELKTQFAVEEAKAEIFELTTKKGFVFKDELELFHATTDAASHGSYPGCPLRKVVPRRARARPVVLWWRKRTRLPSSV